MKSDKDKILRDMALRMGATVTLSNGEVFNADGVRGRATDAPKQKQADTGGNEQLLRAILDMLQKQQPTLQAMPELPAPIVHVEPAQITVQPAPVPAPALMSWKFTFERNESGTIRSITATPTV